MTPLEKFREVVAATRASGGKFVVRTLDEAQALLDELDGKRPRRLPTAADVRGILADPPGDDEVV